VDDAERPGRVQPSVEPVVPKVLEEEEGAEMEGDLGERRQREGGADAGNLKRRRGGLAF
jgi:hypothetical protein